MSVMVKRWYRSRKGQIVIFILILLCIVYYMRLNQSLHTEPDLDLTRSTTAYASMHSKASSKVMVKAKKSAKINKRDSLLEFIEGTLQEALKTDKGTGCQLPELDPFSKEVMQYDKAYPHVTCPGRDWVKCYFSECRVVKEILSTTNDIVCNYQDIIYHSDYKHTLGPPTEVVGADAYILNESDHVKVKCTGTHTNSLLTSKWKGHSLGFRKSVERKPPPPNRRDTLNVLIFGYDSTSKNGFIRRMPKTYRYLTNALPGTLLHGYNIVGDGTPAALFPILTGKTELELPDVRKKINNGTLDSMPFIFYKLKEDGYRTAYFEDMPWIGTFQYRFNGFRKQPADHYLRSFYLEESGNGKRWWKNKNNKYCVGDTPQYQLMMNITDQFLQLDGKKFCFTFIADITHDDFNMISTADDATVHFLQTLVKRDTFKDTMLIIMGDHGTRFAAVRNTLQGKLEERLPLMYILLPDKLKQMRPNAQATLEENAQSLTTPHDIHATILDVLDMPQYMNPYKVAGADLLRGMSLLDPIPKNRSCSEAGIEPHWCACVAWKNVSDSEPVFKQAAEAFVRYINLLTDPVREYCMPRTLIEVKWVMRQSANKKLLLFSGAKDDDGYTGNFKANIQIVKENYQLKVAVGPGYGIYEATMTHIVKEDKFLIDTRGISRTNAYGDEPSCISATHPHLNMYCYCRNHVTKL